MTLDEAKKRYPGAVAFSFGSGPRMADELAALVREGKKTATCMPVAQFDDAPDGMPVVGRRDIVLGGNGAPVLVIETLELTRRRFGEVEEEFALAEGEFDDLADWQRGQQGYFERNGGFSPDMELICERFRVVEVL